MKLNQRIPFITIGLLSCGFIVLSQATIVKAQGSLATPKDDDCPPAVMISDSYSMFTAQVLEVVDGNTLIVKSKDSKRKVIHLVGIAAPDLKTSLGISSKKHLANLVLGKTIFVWLISTNERNATPRQATGRVTVTDPELIDVNLEQIKAGMAEYRNFGAYTQDARDVCLYEKAETEAKAAKRGIWMR